MSSKVATYFLVKDRFVPVGEYTGSLPDKNYIEGAIDCWIDGRHVIGFQHWDLVDQLWAYIVQGLTKLKQGEDYDAFFPDQPLRLRFRPISDYSAEVTIGVDSQKLAPAALITTLAEGARDFFTRMKQLAPSAYATWDRYLTMAEALLNSK